MCGICGISYKNNIVNKKYLNNAVKHLYNRGPNYQEIWINDNVGLGHARLSILDLDNSANQPMESRCGRYIIIYNGEIYNFKEIKNEINQDKSYWKTNGDTEVIIESFIKWGEQCLDKFNGMFAFCIYDKKEQSFFCARDRIGKKPFYYSFYNGNFVFASRIKSLFELIDIPKNKDKEALKNYFEIGYFPRELTIYKNIKKLPAGHKLIYKNEKLSISKYWEYRNIEIDESYNYKNEDKILDELDELLLSSVKYRMVSDVPIGSFLSGGIDSSLVTAMMSRLSDNNVSTFSIGFNEKKYDESIYAKEVANYLNTNHFEKFININDLKNLMPIFLKNFDEPFFDSSVFPNMAVSQLAKENVSVVLTGDGADEIFGGYHYYLIIEKLKYFYLFPKSIRNILSKLIYLLPIHQFRLLSYAINQNFLEEAFAFSRSIIKDFDYILNQYKDYKSIKQKFKEVGYLFPNNLDVIEKAMRIDSSYTLVDDYLQKVDGATMSFSLEARSPFLDYKVLEWSAKLPIQYKVKNGVNKYLLRKLAYRYIPQKILDRPKQGFRIPIAEWLRNDLYMDFINMLNKSNLEIDKNQIMSLLNLHKNGKRDISPLLWAIYMYLKWEQK